MNQGHHSIEEAVKTTQSFGSPVPYTDDKIDFNQLLNPKFVHDNERLEQVKKAYSQFFN